jgi:WD40 repeat protein
MSVDAAHRWVVCGGVDPAVRIYSLPTMRLVRTIFPPAGLSNEGEPCRVAISRDGLHIIVTTQQKAAWFADAAVMIFDRRTGRMTHCIPGLQGTVTTADMTADSRRLIIGQTLRTDPLHARGIVREFALDTKARQLWADSNFQNCVWGVRAGTDGRRVVCCDDGQITLFSSTGKRLSSVKAVASDSPREPRYSPDGRFVAIGGTIQGPYGLMNVEIRAASDLSLVAVPDSKGITNGLSVPCWSADGRQLAAGCESRIPNGGFQLRIWSTDGFQKHFDVTLPNRSRITSIVALTSGFLVRTEDSEAFDVTQAGAVSVLQRPPKFIWNDGGPDEPNRLRASPDLRRVEIACSYPKPGWLRIDADSTVAPEVSKAESLRVSGGLREPTHTSPSLRVTFPDGEPYWRLNGNPLLRPPGNPVNGWTFLADDSGVVTAALWSIRCYDRNGKLRWLAPCARQAYEVVSSSDGKLVVASSQDGTVRWYRTRDGSEALSLYIDPVTKDWVRWTGQGYYDCSPSAERLLVWQLNRGIAAAAETFDAATLRRRFYRPDIVRRSLSSESGEAAAEAANLTRFGFARVSADGSVERLVPPTLSDASATLISEDHNLRVHLRARLTANSGGNISAYEMRADGVRVGELRHGAPVGGLITLDLPVTSTEPRIQIVVWCAGHPIAFDVPLDGSSTGQAGVGSASPRLFIIAMAANRPAGERALLTAQSDAKIFARTLRSFRPSAFSQTVTFPLIGPAATLRNFRSAVDAVSAATKGRRRDWVVLYFAGHAKNSSSGYRFLLSTYDNRRRGAASLGADDLEEACNRLSNCSRAVFIDTCFAGALTTSLAAQRNDLSVQLNDVTGGTAVLAACGPTGIAQADGIGFFTSAVVSGIRGKAYSGASRELLFFELKRYLEAAFREGGAYSHLTEQTPIIEQSLFPANFVVAERPEVDRRRSKTK